MLKITVIMIVVYCFALLFRQEIGYDCELFFRTDLDIGRHPEFLLLAPILAKLIIALFRISERRR